MGNTPIKSFTDLEAWRQGHQLVLLVYRFTKLFPREEAYILIDQLRRAVVSVTSNVAEGFRRSTRADKRHFYVMSLASLSEIQNQLIIARDLGYISVATFQTIAEQTVKVARLLQGLIKSATTRRV